MDACKVRSNDDGMHAAFPVALVIVSAVVYHLAQKSLGAASSPWPVLALAYAIALVITLLLALASGDDLVRLPPRSDATAALLIGLGALGVEAGFFFAYRAGWPLASASVIANAVVTVILAAIGALVLGEHISPTRGTGLGFAVTAAFLLALG